MSPTRKETAAFTHPDPPPALKRQPWLVTAGGKIVCRRCTALSKRTQLQCRRPALMTSRNAKCQFHGGASTGSLTAVGRAIQAERRLHHGRETLEQRQTRSRKAAELRQIEDIARVIGVIKSQRTAGRKPKGYIAIRTIEQALSFRDANPVQRVWPRPVRSRA